MSANDKAQAILIVIKKLLKWVAIAILTLIAIGLLIFAWSKFDDWYTVDRHKKNIQVVALFGEKVCTDKKFPMLLGVVNNSTKTIEKIYVYVKVNRIGYSSKLNRWGSLDYDKIIKPGESWGQCWSVVSADYDKPNLDGVDLEAEIESFTPIFRDAR